MLTTSGNLCRAVISCRLTLPIPLLALLSACGGRYELGEVIDELNRDNPIALDSIGQVVIDEIEDGDAPLSSETVALIGSGGLGDVDGDGHGDWIAEARGVDVFRGLGRSEQRLVYGGPRPANGSLAGTPGPFISEPLTVDIRVPRPGGDIDGDGYGDVLWSSFGNAELRPGYPLAALFAERSSLLDEQRSYLLHGSPDRDVEVLYLPDVGVTFDPFSVVRDAMHARLSGLVDAQADRFDASQIIDLTSLGDLDADGFADFACSYSFSWVGLRPSEWDANWFEATDTGQQIVAVTYLFYGGAGRLTADPLAARAAELPGVREVAALGDIDGDGFPELAAKLEDGQAYLIPGGPPRALGTVHPRDAGMRLDVGDEGSVIQSAGDMDEDGYAELVVTRNHVEGSAAYLFYGGSDRLNAPFIADSADAAFLLDAGMTRLLPLGDWNGDGKADLLAELQRAQEDGLQALVDSRSSVSLIPGSFERYSGVYVTPFIDPEVDPENPALLQYLSITPLGDIDGDGLADVQFVSDGGTMIKYGGQISPSIQ